MALPMHYILEETLLTACKNLGKNLIQQCLQQEVLSSDGTNNVLHGACQALSEAILKSVQLRISEDGCVTQKEILSYACRELAKLIKTQCPRGPGEMCRMQGELERMLSEGSLATKLSEVINTRELVECVCSRHEAGLRTVLLTACQWLMNDIKALFLCEEFWSNFFGDEHLVCAAIYTHLRPLLSTLVYQINLRPYRAWEETHLTGHIAIERSSTFKENMNHLSYSRKDEYTQSLSYNDSWISPNLSKNGSQNVFSLHMDQAKYMNESCDFKMVINDREAQVSYIIEFMSIELKQTCSSLILRLWCALVNTNVFVSSDLYNERVCYLVTFGRHPMNALELLSLDKSEDRSFKADVTIREVSCPVWPKDKSVVKRLFNDPRSQVIEESGDWSNQCFQIWRIGSRKTEKRYPKTISIKSVESRNVSLQSHERNHRMHAKKTTGCFHFSKTKESIDDL